MKKIKDYKMSFVASILFIIIPIVVGIIMWDRLPSQMALHFDLNGNPNGYYSKGIGVFGIYLFILAIHIFTSVYTAFEFEKSHGIPEKIYGMLLWICPIVSTLVAVVVYSYALGINIDVLFWCMVTVGFIFLITGNYIPKVRQNRLVGLRNKWTSESKKNWANTNRFSGYTLFVLGIVSIAMAFLHLKNVIFDNWIPTAWIALIILSVFSMMIYSGCYHSKHKNDADY